MSARLEPNAAPVDYHGDFAAIYDEMHHAVYPPDAAVMAFERHVEPPPGAEILDLGCGTGSHAVALARRGHSVLGIDVSEPMVARARGKGGAGAVAFRCCDVMELADAAPAPHFDAFLSLSNVLNCLPDMATMETTLRALARVLRPGSRGLVDVWNILPVLEHGTRDTVRPLSVNGGDIVQTMRASLDRDAQALTIDYLIFVSRDGARTWRHVSSEHRLRLLRPEEYERLFAAAGFAVRAVVPQHPRDETRPATSNDRLLCYVVERI